MDGGKDAVERIFDAFDEVGFVVENTGGLFHELAASFFEVGDGLFCFVEKVGDDAESFARGGGGGEAEGVGKDAVD